MNRFSLSLEEDKASGFNGHTCLCHFLGDGFTNFPVGRCLNSYYRDMNTDLCIISGLYWLIAFSP